MGQSLTIRTRTSKRKTKKSNTGSKRKLVRKKRK